MKQENFNKMMNFISSNIEWIIFGWGASFGIGDALADPNLSRLEYLSNGLDISVAAFIVAYGVSSKLNTALKTALPLYTGYLAGEMIVQYIRGM